MNQNLPLRREEPMGNTLHNAGLTSTSVYYGGKRVTLNFQAGAEEELNRLAAGVSKEKLCEALIAQNGGGYGGSLVVTVHHVQRLDSAIKSKMSQGMQKSHAVYQLVSQQNSSGFQGGSIPMGSTANTSSTTTSMGATVFDNRNPGQRNTNFKW